jgi:dynein heavy chain 1
VQDFEDILTDANFTKRLEANVKSWLVDIGKITKLEHVISSGTAMQEVNFWNQMVFSLEHVQAQLKTTEVMLIKELIRRMQKLIVLTQFENDNDVDGTMRKARDHSRFLKEIPLTQMLEATTIESMPAIINSLFT